MTAADRPIYVVIPCSGAKADAAAPARDLYTGSMFRRALEAAEGGSFGEATVLILSAEHGLVALDTVLAPYERKMGDPGSVTAETVLAQAIEFGLADHDIVDVYSMVPAAYFRVLDEALRSLYIYAADCYEGALGVGDHRSMLRCAVEYA